MARSPFFVTQPRPCAYLPGRLERNVFMDLDGPDPASAYDGLVGAGFRRSHQVAFRPACPGCRACVPVRVVAAVFAPRRWMRRVLNANRDLLVEECPPHGTAEQYRLFRAYQAARHARGEMATMGFADYRAMVEDSPIESIVVEFREGAGALVAVCLCDRLENGLSAVYSFFDPAVSRRALGNYMVLWLIERARALGLAHVYLGYWIESSDKMAYKARFRPLEALGPDGWRAFDEEPRRGRRAAARGHRA